jgi:hypothetical protein
VVVVIVNNIALVLVVVEYLYLLGTPPTTALQLNGITKRRRRKKKTKEEEQEQEEEEGSRTKKKEINRKKQSQSFLLTSIKVICKLISLSYFSTPFLSFLPISYSSQLNSFRWYLPLWSGCSLFLSFFFFLLSYAFLFSSSSSKHEYELCSESAIPDYTFGVEYELGLPKNLGSAKEVALKLKELSELPVYFFGVTHRVIRRKDIKREI